MATRPGGGSGCDEKWRDMGVLPEVMPIGLGDRFSAGVRRGMSIMTPQFLLEKLQGWLY